MHITQYAQAFRSMTLILPQPTSEPTKDIAQGSCIIVTKEKRKKKDQMHIEIEVYIYSPILSFSLA